MEGLSKKDCPKITVLGKGLMKDLIIIGAGPAGICAGVYAERYKMNFLIMGEKPGGTVNEAHKVENYLGFGSINGKDLAERFASHIKSDIVNERAERICSQKDFFEIQTNRNKYKAKSLIISLGMKSKKLDLENEAKFLNQSIFYYLPSKASIFNQKEAAVVGGGDSALDAVLKISLEAKKVYLIHRRNEFRGSPDLLEKAEQKENVTILRERRAKSARGGKKLEKIILDNGKEIKIDLLFVQIGGVPNVSLCANLSLEMKGSFIKTDKTQSTNRDGVFAAGDITNNPLKQIITAAAEGAIAATSAYRFIKGTNN